MQKQLENERENTRKMGTYFVENVLLQNKQSVKFFSIFKCLQAFLSTFTTHNTSYFLFYNASY